MRRPGFQSRGYSLLELLTALAVVAVLITLVLGSLARARKSARTVACLTQQRQVAMAFMTAASNLGGRSPVQAPSAAGTLWVDTLASSMGHGLTARNTPTDRIVQCPEATTLSYAQGTMASSWGPSASGATWMGTRSGSYGLNTVVYPGSGNTADGVLCNTFGLATGPGGSAGNGTINTAVAAVTSVYAKGNLTFNGNLTAGGGITLTGSSAQAAGRTQTPYAKNLKTVDVAALYSSLLAKATPVSGTTLDFSKNAVLAYAGSLDLKKCTVIGSGTLLVSGTANLNSDAALNVICLGTLDVSAAIRGGLYAVGDISTRGRYAINGPLVTTGDVSLAGNGVINGGTLPAFDPRGTGSSGGIRGSLYASTLGAPHQIPLLADSIWVDATPSPADAWPADLTRGDMNTGLGRYLITRHNRAVNVAFLDGSARTVSLGTSPKDSELYKLRWNASF